jgi:hypothetical protein
MDTNNPFFWIGTGIGIGVIGFLFLDTYVPMLGLAWNIMNGNVGGIGYRYVLTLAVTLILYGAYLWASKQKQS